jgi:hypothetical protein
MSIDDYTQDGPLGFLFDAVPSEGTDKHGNVRQTESSRSAANIRAWRSYLPPECVETMIRMGWDRSV